MQVQPIGQLLLALAVATAPLCFALPWWAIGWCMAFWGYLWVRGPAHSAVPSRSIRLIFFSIGLILVFISAGLRFDGSDFITLLAVMAGVKPLEVRGHRDSMVTVFLAYFLTITSLFVFENLAMTVYLFISVWVTTAVLIHVNHPAGSFGPQLKLSARLVLWAVPLMMVFFLAFPRLSGSLMNAPWSRQNRSGFSTLMRMGDVSRLVTMDTPAFSVFFDSSLPEADQRYWRGIVFQSFDGDTWTPIHRQRARRSSIKGKVLTRYRVVLEPHGHRNLFALDLPVTATPVATIMADHTLQTRRPVRQRLTYAVTTALDHRQDRIGHPGDRYLQLPANRNPQTLELGRQLALAHTDPTARVRAGLDLFRSEGFTYTLKPDRLGRDAVDDFLFISRNGFCEHFASAFTVLMRSAGVPVRMVGGYLGGRWNAVGHFLTVRQADAHVWCEVWIKGAGWVRVDPTLAVAPDRVDDGIDGFLNTGSWLSVISQDHWLRRWIETIRLGWQTVNFRWDIWFMGFSATDQAALVKKVWHWRYGVLLVGALLGLTIAAFFVYRRQRQRQPVAIEDQALILYNRFLKKMSRIGLAKPPYQGAYDYSRRVAGDHPAFEKAVAEIVDCYLSLRYGREPGDDDLKTLRQLVRRFHPRKRLKMDNE
ncbi:transglutaminase domain protein [Desulfosarcina variabilis str. Montpellier]|uniref:transglutaminase TgpA family protein n=1 Tax=Desulfosarcina variabilis TaxID=2300 RepID=UPI003AFB65CE